MPDTNFTSVAVAGALSVDGAMSAKTVSPASQELTASGAVGAGRQAVELNHATVAIDATLAALPAGLFVIKDTSASGTAAHNLILGAGTFDGTNNKVTFDAPGEAIVVYVDSAGVGVMVTNVGSATMASV